MMGGENVLERTFRSVKPEYGVRGAVMSGSTEYVEQAVTEHGADPEAVDQEVESYFEHLVEDKEAPYQAADHVMTWGMDAHEAKEMAAEALDPGLYKEFEQQLNGGNPQDIYQPAL